jgi:hypothetical protein
MPNPKNEKGHRKARRLDMALPKQGNNMQFAFMADHEVRGQ